MMSKKLKFPITVVLSMSFLLSGCSSTSTGEFSLEIEESQVVDLFYKSINEGNIELALEVLENTNIQSHPDLFVDYYVHTRNKEELLNLYNINAESLSFLSHRKVFRYLKHNESNAIGHDSVICFAVKNIKQYNEFSMEVDDAYQQCTAL